MSQLIGIHRDAGCASQMREAAQYLRKGPRHLPAAKRVERIESDLNPFEQADSLDVIDGNSIFKGQSGHVRAQRQALRGWQVPQVNGNAPADVGAHDGSRIAQRRSVEFAVAHQHDLANQVHDRFAGCA